jgi:fumarate hydratase class II
LATGSGTQNNMNVNEVVANRAQVLKDLPLAKESNSLKQMMMSISHNHQTIHSQPECTFAYKAVIEVNSGVEKTTRYTSCQKLPIQKT